MRNTHFVATITVALALSLATVPSVPNQAAAQQGDIQVLVAPLSVGPGVNNKFGERVADQVREALETFSGLAPLDWGDVKDAVEDFGLDWKQLTPIEWRQLAGRLEAQLVMVGTAAQAGGALNVEVSFIDPRSGDELPVPSFSVASDRQHKQAAAQITGGLEQQVAYQRSVVFCQEYLGSQQLEDAMRNCEAALDVNPGSPRALYLRGRVHMEGEEWDAAIVDLEEVVQQDPSNTEALQSLAYSHAQVGNGDRSLELYREYLNFNPDDADVRLNVAFKLASAEAYDPAIAILQEGVERDENNAALWEYLGNVALARGTQRAEASEGTSGSLSDPASVRLAVDAYDRVLTLSGDSINPSMLRNLIAANTELGDLDRALEFSERGLTIVRQMPEPGADAEEGTQSPTQLLAEIHSIRADIYDRMEQPAQAVAEMDRTLENDPDYPRAYWKRGNFRLSAGDTNGAVADFRLAAGAGSDPDQIAHNLFARGYQEHFQQGRYGQAIRLFSVALELAESPQEKQQIHFFSAYGYYQQASAIDASNERAEACEPARRALNAFRRVGPHLGQAGSYQASSQAQIREAVEVQVYRQDQIIRKACN
jgi:tetratricopeptide (TPR) repeat protein